MSFTSKAYSQAELTGQKVYHLDLDRILWPTGYSSDQVFQFDLLPWNICIGRIDQIKLVNQSAKEYFNGYSLCQGFIVQCTCTICTLCIHCMNCIVLINVPIRQNVFYIIVMFSILISTQKRTFFFMIFYSN